MAKPDVIEQNPLNLKTYRDNDQIKAHNVQFEWEDWQIEEYEKCAACPKYFARNYIKIINLDDGLVPFDLYPYQEEMYDTVTENRFTITLAARQAGKSIAFVIYLLWYAHSFFNRDVRLSTKNQSIFPTILKSSPALQVQTLSGVCPFTFFIWMNSPSLIETKNSIHLPIRQLHPVNRQRLLSLQRQMA